MIASTESNSSLNRKTINEVLAEHQEKSDWVFARQTACLKRWFDRFNCAFCLHVEAPAIAIKPLRRSRLGHFCDFPNWFGLDHEIAFNLRFLPEMSPCDTLMILLHEELHLWQLLHGKPGRGNYHNVQFQKKAAQLGLIVNGKGNTEIASAPSLFLDLIDHHRDDLAELEFSGHPVIEKQATKLLKWSCSCPRPVNVRCAVELRATCNLCGQQFVRQFSGGSDDSE